MSSISQLLQLLRHLFDEIDILFPPIINSLLYPLSQFYLLLFFTKLSILTLLIISFYNLESSYYTLIKCNNNWNIVAD